MNMRNRKAIITITTLIATLAIVITATIGVISGKIAFANSGTNSGSDSSKYTNKEEEVATYRSGTGGGYGVAAATRDTQAVFIGIQLEPIYQTVTTSGLGQYSLVGTRVSSYNSMNKLGETILTNLPITGGMVEDWTPNSYEQLKKESRGSQNFLYTRDSGTVFLNKQHKDEVFNGKNGIFTLNGSREDLYTVLGIGEGVKATGSSAVIENLGEHNFEDLDIFTGYLYDPFKLDAISVAKTLIYIPTYYFKGMTSVDNKYIGKLVTLSHMRYTTLQGDAKSVFNYSMSGSGDMQQYRRNFSEVDTYTTKIRSLMSSAVDGNLTLSDRYTLSAYMSKIVPVLQEMSSAGSVQYQLAVNSSKGTAYASDEIDQMHGANSYYIPGNALSDYTDNGLAQILSNSTQYFIDEDICCLNNISNERLLSAAYKLTLAKGYFVKHIDEAYKVLDWLFGDLMKNTTPITGSEGVLYWLRNGDSLDVLSDKQETFLSSGYVYDTSTGTDVARGTAATADALKIQQYILDNSSLTASDASVHTNNMSDAQKDATVEFRQWQLMGAILAVFQDNDRLGVTDAMKGFNIKLGQIDVYQYTGSIYSKTTDDEYTDALVDEIVQGNRYNSSINIIGTTIATSPSSMYDIAFETVDSPLKWKVTLAMLDQANYSLTGAAGTGYEDFNFSSIIKQAFGLITRADTYITAESESTQKIGLKIEYGMQDDTDNAAGTIEAQTYIKNIVKRMSSTSSGFTETVGLIHFVNAGFKASGSMVTPGGHISYSFRQLNTQNEFFGNGDNNIGSNFGGSLLNINVTLEAINSLVNSGVTSNNFATLAYYNINNQDIPRLNKSVINQSKISFGSNDELKKYGAMDVLQLTTWSPKVNATQGIDASGKLYTAISGAANAYTNRMIMRASYNSILTQHIHNFKGKDEKFSRGAATTRWFMNLTYVRIHREKECDVSLVLGFENKKEENTIQHDIGISSSEEYPDLVLGMAVNSTLLDVIKDENKVVTVDILMETTIDGSNNTKIAYVGKKDEKAKITTINASLYNANCFAWNKSGSSVGGYGALICKPDVLKTVPAKTSAISGESNGDEDTAYIFKDIYYSSVYKEYSLMDTLKPKNSYLYSSGNVKSINLSEWYREKQFDDAVNFGNNTKYDFEIDRWNISSFAEEESSTELQYDRAYSMGAEVIIRIKDLETDTETVCYYTLNDTDADGNKITLPKNNYDAAGNAKAYTVRGYGIYEGRYRESFSGTADSSKRTFVNYRLSSAANMDTYSTPGSKLAGDDDKTSVVNKMWFRVKNVPAAPIVAKGSVIYEDDGQHIKSDVTVGSAIGTNGVLSISLEWSMDEELNKEQIELSEYMDELESMGITTILVRVTEDVARDKIYNVIDSDGTCEPDSDGWLTAMIDRLKLNSSTAGTMSYTLEQFRTMLENKETLKGEFKIPDWNNAVAAHKEDGVSGTTFHDSTAVKVAYGYDINILGLSDEALGSLYSEAAKGGMVCSDTLVKRWVEQRACYDILNGGYTSSDMDEVGELEIGESREVDEEHECYLIAGAYEFQPEPIYVRSHSTLEDSYLPLSYGTVKEGNYSSGSVVPAQNYNVLTGVPSTSKLYFTSGGSEFIVELTLVEIKGETAARTYTSYFASRPCKFSYSDTSSAGGGTTTSVNKAAVSHEYNNESTVATLTDKFNIAVPVDYTSATYTVPEHGGTTIIAVWTGTIANNTADPGVEGIKQPVDNITAGATHYTGMPGNMIRTGQENSGGSYVWDVSEYNSDLEKAYNWGLAVEQASATVDGNVTIQSDSDHATRRWHAGDAVIDIKFNNVNALNNGNSDYYHTAAHEATLSNTVVNTSNWSTMKLITNDTRLSSGWFESYGHAQALSCSSCISTYSRNGRYDEGYTDTWNDEVSFAAFTPTTLSKQVLANYTCNITGDESTGYSHSATPNYVTVTYQTCWCGYDQSKTLRDANACTFSTSDSPEEVEDGVDPVTGKPITHTEHHYTYSHTAHSGNTAISPHTCYARHSVSAWKETVTRKAPDLTYTITVTFKGSYVDGVKGTDGYAQKVSTADSVYEAHCCCGPCCSHILPTESDNWMQYVTYDYVAIEDISVWKIYRSYVKGLNNITYDYDTTDHLLGKIESGDPNIWYNIGDMNLVYRDHLLYGVKQEASAAGRLRYSVQAQQLDDVIWAEKNTEGVNVKVVDARPGDCDGQASTVRTNGVYVEGIGHDLTYAFGNMYARTVEKYGNNLGTDDASVSYPGDVYSDMIESLTYTYDDVTYTNRYYVDNPDTVNHRDVFTHTDNWIDSLGTSRVKRTYENNSTDARDIGTLEFKRWKERRNSDVTAYVASDLLVLQDSFGDRKVVYASNSATAETEQDIKGITMSAEDALLNQAEECVDPDFFDTDWFTKDKLLGGYIGTGNTNSGVTGQMFTGGSSTRVETVLDTDTNRDYVASYTHTDPNANVTPPRISFKTVARQNDTRNPADYKSSACLGQLRMTRPNGLRIGIQNVQINPITLNGLYQSEIAVQSWFNILRWTDTSSIAKDYQFTPQFEGTSDPILGEDLYLQEAYYYESDVKPKVNNVVIHTPVSNMYTYMEAYLGPMNDQRVTEDALITKVDALGYCPGDAESCEYSFLNCKYGVRTAVFATKFDPETVMGESGSALQIVDTIKGLNIFTDKADRIINDSNGNPRLVITATNSGSSSFDIPLKNIELQYTSTLEYTINMTYCIPNITSDVTLISVGDIKLYTKSNDDSYLYLKDGDGCEYRYTCSPAYNDKELSLKVSYNGLAYCELTLNGTKLTGEVMSESSTAIQEAELSNYLRIGDSRNKTSIQVDNIVIYREAGSTSHTAGCYTVKTTHETVDNYTCDTPTVINAGTEGAQSFTAPVSGYYLIECYGAQGALGSDDIEASNLGGYASGKVYLNAGQTIYAYVGKAGTKASEPNAEGSYEETGVRGAGGGWNGGGDASYGGYGGGGMTYVSLVSTDKETTKHISYNYEDGNGRIATGEADLATMSMNTDPNKVLVVAGGGAGKTTSLEPAVDIGGDSALFNQLYYVGTVTDFTYTGAVQEFEVPYNGYYKLEAWGAQGGGEVGDSKSSHAGLGGYTAGTVYLTAGTKIYIYVGQQGAYGAGSNPYGGPAATFNGGGYGGNSNSGAGGGATDFRLVGGAWNSSDGLKSRILVAGAGGGSDNSYDGAAVGSGDDGSGGAGGGLTGGNAGVSGRYVSSTGGTQSSGGGFGYGANAGSSIDTGGAGGGYYGGKVTNNNNGGGGGGSSYVSGYTGCDTTYLNNQKVNGKALQFTDVTLTQGGHSGNGTAKITCVGLGSTDEKYDIKNSNGYTFTKVFSHDSSKGVFLNQNEATHTGSLSTPEKYSILDQLDKLKSTKEAKYVFMLYYPETGQMNIWKQSTNPLNTTSADGTGSGYVPGYEAVSISMTGDYWGGLEKSSRGATLLDGSTNHADWWYAIGAYQHYPSDSVTTIPGGNSTKVTKVELWLATDIATDIETVYNLSAIKSTDFGYTGNVQTYTIPEDGVYKLETWGASGGGNQDGDESMAGYGGYTSGTVALKKGTVLYIYVGGKGQKSTTSTVASATFNGGGDGGSNMPAKGVHLGGSGGGATDIRLLGGAWNDNNGLRSRLIVAGGGGGEGCASSHNRGNGGGLIGANTYNTQHYYGASASGGSQTAGGTGIGEFRNTAHSTGGFGYGANACQCGAGGGGGYYGGGSEYTAGGGGGSSYVSGYTGCDTTYLGSQKVDGKNVNFVDVRLEQGTNYGNGRARITLIEKAIGGASLTNEQKDSVDKTVTFTSNGQYVIPTAGIYQLTIYGGAGGGTSSTHGGASGGQGGTAIRYAYLTEGQVVSYNLGAKGVDCSSCNSWTDFYYNNCPSHSGSVWYGTEWNCSGSDGGISTVYIDGVSVAQGNGGGGGRSSRDDSGNSHCHPYTSNSNGGAGGATSTINYDLYPTSVTLNDITYTSMARSGGNTGAGKIEITLKAIDEEQYRKNYDDSVPTTGEGAGYVNAKSNEGYERGQGENYVGVKSVGGAGAGWYGGRVNSTTGETGYGSSYVISTANTSTITDNVNSGDGVVVITLMEHTHTSTCGRSDNTYNNHVHSGSCICSTADSYEALEREINNAVYNGKYSEYITSMLQLKQGATTIESIINKCKSGQITASNCLSNVISVLKAQSADTLNSIDMYNGHNNPIFGCYNHNDVHICSDKCVTEQILTCTEPHHSGSHYGHGNEICYDACNDDSKHRTVKDMTGVDASQVGTRIQIDDYFTIYWDNVGNFYDSTANNVRYGASIEDNRRGQGYSDGMDTTSWIRMKSIRFDDCDVLFYNEHTGKWEEYRRGEQIKLPITTDGVAGNGDDDLKRDWTDRDQSDIAVTEYKFYLLLDNEEVRSTKYEVWTAALNDAPTNTSKTTPYVKGESISNSNEESTNKVRPDAAGNFSAFSTCYNWNEFDIVGHIGNLLVTYADDFRYMNFFKKTTSEYLVEPFIYKIVENEQTNYLGIGITETGIKGTSSYSYYLSDVRSREVKKDTGYYNTWDTQEWAEKANPVDNILSSDVRTIHAVEGQEMPLGYAMFAEITTIGDYNEIKVKPSIYVLDTETGEVMQADVWTKSSSGYKLIYLAGTDEQDIATLINYGLNAFSGTKYSLIKNATFETNYTYVALGDEKGLRNVSDEEIAESQRLADYFFPSMSIDDSGNGLYENVTIGESNVKVTELKTAIGNTNMIKLGGKQRLFIGSSKVRAEVFNGQNDTNFEHKVDDDLFKTQARRWLFTIGLPENSYVVPYSAKYANGRHMNPNYILEDGTDAIKDVLYTQESLDTNRYYVLYAVDTMALGEVWNLEYEAFEQAQTIKVDGRQYTLPDTIPDVIAVMDLDMKEQDYDIIRTH